MFTGIIEGVGSVRRLEPVGGDLRLTVAVGTLPFERVELGESIAVNGCCLTVIAFDHDSFDCDVSPETLRLTTLGTLAEGAPVNLERALLPTQRLGGHLVSGHVDGLGAVRSITPEGRALVWWFEAPDSLLRYIAVKGSVAINGVSLTVNAVDAHGFAVALIPHTVANTTFGSLSAGSPVNLEIDTVARYVERLLQFNGAP
ncbi:riboflavin synthase [Luteimonas sp. FXH3W]|jgi:riboflavin synthase|uniref:Riboflavin synthase n=1 Tax=Aquilutibacter rugosus TaxID=3115820 RepID=A0ABU7UZS3_9GAMM